MGDIAIHVSGLGKEFKIGKIQRKHTRLYDLLGDTFTAPLKRVNQLFRGNASGASDLTESMWALRNVSFDIKKGEIVGIIGRNGAGKSTLLKILSRITPPTEGLADIFGRIGALLEVGTGFHADLTGRENVYLNGSILGMSRKEIDRKFDEIVTFAEVEKFIDTPVKHYSSGMGLRLGFAVAAHLEPEILIVDEVLAVGDASFQKKCLGKMSEVAGEGRTVLFVSHNMAAVTRLCPKSILLDKGTINAIGPSYEISKAYLQSGIGTTTVREWTDPSTAPGNDIARLRAARVISMSGQVVDAVDIRYPFGIEMDFDVLTPGHILVPNLHFFNEDGVCIFISSDTRSEWRTTPKSTGSYKSICWIPGNFLSEGTLIVGVALSTMDPVHVHFFEQDAIACQVVDSLHGDSARGDYAGQIPGIVRPLLQWTNDITPTAEIATIVNNNSRAFD